MIAAPREGTEVEIYRFYDAESKQFIIKSEVAEIRGYDPTRDAWVVALKHINERQEYSDIAIIRPVFIKKNGHYWFLLDGREAATKPKELT